MITDIKPTGEIIELPVPEAGYYVQLHYVYDETDDEKDVVTGPFPMDKKDLLIELLNVLDAMVDLAFQGRNDDDDRGNYSDIVNYRLWFDAVDQNLTRQGETYRNKALRKQLSMSIEQAPDGSEQAILTHFTVWYHDGTSYAKYLQGTI